MKKILAILLVLVLSCLVFASCEYLPESVQDTLNPILDKLGMGGDDTPDLPEDNNGEEAPHEHEFVVIKQKDPTCLGYGVTQYQCSCGESKIEKGDPAKGHTYETTYYLAPTCFSEGSKKENCADCGAGRTETLPATGEHVYDETVEASRIIKCSTDLCPSVKIREFDGKYTEQIKYVFTEGDLDKFYAIYAELEAIINAADAYDPALHAYAEGTELHREYLAMEAKYEELYTHLEYVVSQYQIAQIEYHQVMNSEGKEAAEANFNYISEIRTELIADFYIFSEPIYNSMYREFYYYGMTEQEIMAFIFDSNAIANPEYKALSDRNTEIELQFNSIMDPTSTNQVLSLYAEFVENNNKIAALMGYDNYLEYAYENMYDRDYTYQDVANFANYVKEYIAPLYVATYDKWNALTSAGNFSQGDVNQYYNQVSDSFFETYESNRILNDYIDLLAFTSNPNKTLSFSDEFNSLFLDGNLFRGDYEGAYVTSLYGINTPIAYFGPGYDSPFTVAHEFGHYMNEKYSGGVYSQSYDLLEMHSQGNEMLYLAYLNNELSGTAHELVETYNLLVMLDTIVTALAVDTFEQAVYTNTYDGAYAYIIMEDGVISANEYDLLFKSIIEDFGATGYTHESYWRYVTILAPCYYVSYSVSAISVLQLYPMAQNDFDAAKDAYLKLFTYVDTLEDENDSMTAEEVLEYANLYSFNDERLYLYIYEALYNK